MCALVSDINAQMEIAALSTIDLCYCLLIKSNQRKLLMNNVEIPTDFIQVGLSFEKFFGSLLVFQKSSRGPLQLKTERDP